MAISANQRYAIPAAPRDLELAHEFLNTWPHEGTNGVDLLAEPDTAAEWFDYVDGISDLGGSPPHSVKELAELRRVRDVLRAALLRNADVPARPIARTLKVEITADGVMAIRPTGSAVDRFLGAVFGQLLLAQSTSELRRLKICADPICLGAFYDHSPNVSRVWHDPATCGNRANLKASRARRRARELG